MKKRTNINIRANYDIININQTMKQSVVVVDTIYNYNSWWLFYIKYNVHDMFQHMEKRKQLTVNLEKISQDNSSKES